MNKKNDIKALLKRGFIIFGVAVLTALFSNEAQAQYTPGQYGQTAGAGEIQVDKKVKNPSNGNFVENLGIGDYHFSPGEEVLFRIVIKNNGKASFAKVTFKDVLPGFVELVSGDLNKEYLNVNAGETREFEVKVKVVGADKLPEGQGLFCLVNKAEVVADSQTDDDMSQFCIETKVLGVTTQPKSGAEVLLLSLGSLIITSSGLILNKKYSKA